MPCGHTKHRMGSRKRSFSQGVWWCRGEEAGFDGECGTAVLVAEIGFKQRWRGGEGVWPLAVGCYLGS